MSAQKSFCCVRQTRLRSRVWLKALALYLKQKSLILSRKRSTKKNKKTSDWLFFVSLSLLVCSEEKFWEAFLHFLQNVSIFFSKTILLLYYLREKEPLLCDDAFKEQQRRQHATTTKEFVLFSSNRNKIKIKEKRCFFCFLSLLSWRNVPPFLKLSKRTDTLARDKRRQSSSGAMTTRGQQRRRGDERDSLWDLVAKCDDICFKNTFFRDWMGRMWNSCTEWRVRRESWLRDHLARVI